MKSGTEGLTAGLRALITDWVIRHPAVHPYVNFLTINQKETGQSDVRSDVIRCQGQCYLIKKVRSSYVHPHPRRRALKQNIVFYLFFLESSVCFFFGFRQHKACVSIVQLTSCAMPVCYFPLSVWHADVENGN